MIKGITRGTSGADNVLVFDLGDDYTGSCSIIIVLLLI